MIDRTASGSINARALQNVLLDPQKQKKKMLTTVIATTIVGVVVFFVGKFGPLFLKYQANNRALKKLNPLPTTNTRLAILGFTGAGGDYESLFAQVFDKNEVPYSFVHLGPSIDGHVAVGVSSTHYCFWVLKFRFGRTQGNLDTTTKIPQTIRSDKTSKILYW